MGAALAHALPQPSKRDATQYHCTKHERERAAHRGAAGAAGTSPQGVPFDPTADVIHYEVEAT
eukprot:4556575-Alexandrium_andersonii.AAC.1